MHNWSWCFCALYLLRGNHRPYYEILLLFMVHLVLLLWCNRPSPTSASDMGKSLCQETQNKESTSNSSSNKLECMESRIFRGTTRSVDACIANVFFDINDWASLILEGDMMEEYREPLSRDNLYSNMLQRGLVSPMDKEKSNT